MECPHCGETLPSKTCPDCGGEVPENSLYCLVCGAPFEEESPPAVADDESGLDFENRVLCPDGACTGIIESGRCTECGRAYDGSAGPEAEADAEGEVEESRD
ncbi:MAG: hypothetical protein K9M82_08555 [Deltaproteobacteria bacterium]|nr:hypothetical protein [Deltaproteobacteria bacterium]